MMGFNEKEFKTICYNAACPADTSWRMKIAGPEELLKRTDALISSDWIVSGAWISWVRLYEETSKRDIFISRAY